jgi:hypothetical protein
MRRIRRGDIHRRGVAALIGEHGRKIFPLARRSPGHAMRGSPRRGEVEQDWAEPSERRASRSVGTRRR